MMADVLPFGTVRIFLISLCLGSWCQTWCLERGMRLATCATADPFQLRDQAVELAAEHDISFNPEFAKMGTLRT
jgi:hypothetical protein